MNNEVACFSMAMNKEVACCRGVFLSIYATSHSIQNYLPTTWMMRLEIAELLMRLRKTVRNDINFTPMMDLHRKTKKSAEFETELAKYRFFGNKAKTWSLVQVTALSSHYQVKFLHYKYS